MNLRCAIGSHDWVKCTCERCGKSRDEDHDWSRNCEECSICQKARQNAHVWIGCQCQGCGRVAGDGMTQEELLQFLEQAARRCQPLISRSREEHFKIIVRMMDDVGAVRHGSTRVRGINGSPVILDNYTLPGGSRVQAGYEG